MEHRLDRYLDAQDRAYAAAMRREAEEIDRAVCAASICPECGHDGLRFLNIGVGICPACKARLDF